jgi:hypothetical protein
MLIPCSECGRDVSTKAQACMSCGAPPKRRRTPPRTPPPLLSYLNPGRGGASKIPSPMLRTVAAARRAPLMALALSFLAVLIAVGLLDKPESAQPILSESPRPIKDVMWAHGTVSIRASRSDDADAVAHIERGDRVEIDSLVEGWARVFQTGAPRPVGYVATSALSSEVLPDFEIESWNWRKDPGFGSKGAVVWTVEVRNNTRRYIDRLRVNFTTYDASGAVMDSDFLYVTGISPGGTASDKGHASYYGGEEKARVRIET